MWKTWFYRILSVITLACFIGTINAYDAFALTGAGTKDNPFVINSKEELLQVKDNLNGYYKLNADIDLGNTPFSPIGTKALPFKGGFDGNGYKLSNLKITTSTLKEVGFFGATNLAELKNITINNIDVSYTGLSICSVGGLVGDMSGGSISNCHISGGAGISGRSVIGGLVGALYDEGTVSLSGTNVTVKGKDSFVGGLIATVKNGNISKSYANGDVSGEMFVGGLLGDCFYSTNKDIIECYYSGNVTANDMNAGGLVGINNGRSLFKNCFVLGSISAKRGYVYGLGDKGNYENCYFGGKILNPSKSDFVAVIGNAKYYNITNCFYDGVLLGYVDGYESRTTSSMKNKSNYTNWDFEDIWSIEEGITYPWLKSLEKPDMIISEEPQDFAGGKGTKEEPFLINTPTQLDNVRFYLSGFYKLNADIDLGNTPFNPIGTKALPFKGGFDGNGYKISNLKITTSTLKEVGLFGATNLSELKNIMINNIDISYTGTSTFYGGGGLVGYMTGGSISNCHILGGLGISGRYNIGGLVGFQEGKGTITLSSTNIPTKGTGANVGGLTGYVSDSGNISESYAIGDVSGSSYVGGLFGYWSQPDAVNVTECYSTGDVSATNKYAGGIVGDIHGSNIIFKNCYALGTVSADEGYIYGLGLDGKFENCYFAGKIINPSESTLIGGISYYWYNSIVNCFYDGRVVGFVTSYDARNTSSMKSKSNFTNWDFENTWSIEEGLTYPWLKSLPKPDKITSEASLDFAGGIGTKEEPFLINTPTQLDNVRFYLSGFYKLNSDIDLGNTPFNPIGTKALPFKGGFDGNGYKISNLKITTSTLTEVGLFGSTNLAELKNITINNIDISNTGTSTSYTGGLSGYMTGGSISNCHILGGAGIAGESRVGGLVGEQRDKGTITLSSTNIPVKGSGDWVGGLTGYVSDSGDISKSYAIGTVSGANYVGGLFGYWNSSAVINITECYSTGDVTASNRVAGGLGGYINSRNTVFKNCYALGTISAANGDVYGLGYSGKFENCYFGGKILNPSKSTSVGGISFSADDIIINSFYDITKNTGVLAQTAQAKTTSEMQSLSTYSNWDFDNIWLMNQGGYPSLRNAKGIVIEVLETPKNLHASATESQSIKISWDSVDKATYYEVSVNGKVYNVGSEINYVINELSPSTSYEIKVRAVSERAGNWSDPINITTLGALPTVANVKMNSNSFDYIELSWDLVENATKYKIWVTDDNTDEVYESVEPNFNLKGLPDDKTYQVKIKAQNENLESIDWSDSLEIKTLKKLGALNSIETTYLDKSVNLKWDSVEEAQVYEIDFNGNILSTSDLFISINDLTWDKGYLCKIRAKNDNGVGMWFEFIVVKTNLDVPQNIIIEEKTTSSISLAWDVVENAAKYEVTYGTETLETTTNKIVINNLSPLTEYVFKVRAISESSQSDWSSEFSATTEAGIPSISIPTNFRVESKTNNTVTLAWDAVENAEVFEVMFGEQVLTAQGNSITIEDLTLDTEYSFKVRAIIDELSSDWSEPLYVKFVPGSVTKPTINVSVVLSWESIENATEYEISYDNKIVTTDKNSINLELEKNKEYIFLVRAKTSDNPGEWSDPVTIRISTVTQKTLLTPKNFAVSSKTSSSIVLSWSFVEDADEYEITYNDVTVSTSENTKEITGLEPETEYSFKVRAKNGEAVSWWSEILPVTTESNFSALETPINLKVTSKTDQVINLEWDAVENATQYELTYNDISVKTTETSFVIDALEPKTEYTFKVRALNETAESSWSDELTVSTDESPSNEIAIPENFVFADTTTNSVSFSWTGVENASEYEISITAEEEEELIISSNELSIIITGLRSDKEYSFKVRAKDEEKVGEWTKSIVVRTKLGVPKNIEVSEKTHSSINLSWEAIENAIKYEVSYGTELIETTENSIIIENLTPDTEYTFTIRAISLSTEGSWSEEQKVTTDQEAVLELSVPENFKYSDVMADSISFEWTSVADALGYEISVTAEGKEEALITTNELSITINELDSFTDYSFKIRAKNNDTVGVWSDSIAVKTGFGIPQNVIVSEKTYSTITLAWEPVKGATKYEVIYGDETLETLENSILIESLESETEYTFKVRAINESTAGSWSEELAVITETAPIKEISKPENLITSSKTANNVSLSWDVVEDATEYEISIITEGEEEKTLTTQEPTIVISELTADKEYTFKVRAKNESGHSEWSEELAVKTNAQTNDIIAEITTSIVELNELFIGLSADGIDSFENKTFRLTYDSSLSPLDFAAQTAKDDVEVGTIEDTDIEVISATPGQLEFRVNKNVPLNKLWSGIITIVKFKPSNIGEVNFKFEKITDNVQNEATEDVEPENDIENDIVD